MSKDKFSPSFGSGYDHELVERVYEESVRKFIECFVLLSQLQRFIHTLTR